MQKINSKQILIHINKTEKSSKQNKKIYSIFKDMHLCILIYFDICYLPAIIFKFTLFVYVCVPDQILCLPSKRYKFFSSIQKAFLH